MQHWASQLSSIASHHFTCLSHRSILQCKGTDTIKFLQGITTNQMQLLSSQEQQQQISTLILNSKGKIMFDLLITRVDQNLFWIEHDKSLSTCLMELLQRHKLRNKIEFDLLSTIQVGHSFSQEKPTLLSATAIVKDARHPNMGYRCYAKTIESSIKEDYYYLWRAWHGVAEGKEELFFEELPALEANFEHLNSISWNKGCYQGQELTARSYHQGVIRKRILPFATQDKVSLLHNMKLYSDHNSGNKQSSVGKVGSYHSEFQIGFALLRLKPNLFDHPINITATTGEGDSIRTSILPIRPAWFTEECFPKEVVEE